MAETIAIAHLDKVATDRTMATAINLSGTESQAAVDARVGLVAPGIIADNPEIVAAAAALAQSDAGLLRASRGAIPAVTDLNTMQANHAGWWTFGVSNVLNAPAGMSTSAALLEVLVPSIYTAVQRVHDRGTRITYERSIITPSANTWSSWRAIATTDRTLVVREVVGSAATPGDVSTYIGADHLGVWTLWAPYNTGVPKDARGRCTLQVTRDSVSAVSHLLTERESGRVWSNTYTSGAGWSGWADLTKHGALAPFHAALGKAKTRPVNIVMVGDSNGEGQGIADGIDQRWVNKIQRALNKVAGTPAGAKFPFIPAQYGVSEASSPGQPVVSSGNIVSGYDFGFGWRAVTLRDETSQVVFTFEGTAASVMYTTGVNGSRMNIQVDSSPVVVIDTAATTTEPSRHWETGPLTPGTHTITVTWNTANAAGKFVYLEGILTWDGDESAGVRVVDASKSGRQMGQVSNTRANYLARAMVEAGGVDLVIVNLATNDARWDTSAADYRAAAESLVSYMRLYGLHAPVLFVQPFVGADHTREKLDSYGLILGEIATRVPGAAFADVSLDMPQVPEDRNSPAAQGYYVDQLHMTAQGHTAFAGHVLHALSD